MTDTQPKIYGRFTVEIFDDDDALGIKNATFIDESTPDEYKKAINTVLTTLSEKYMLLVLSKADILDKKDFN